FGNLGQDDIIGGSSDLFGLTAPNLRPDGSDLIFGGAGEDIARNGLGDTTSAGHAADSDVILADNGRILRLVSMVNGASAFLRFNYDAQYNGVASTQRPHPPAAPLPCYSARRPSYS